MSKELDVKAIIKRIEGISREEDGAEENRTRVLNVTQEVIGEDSTDICRLLEKMNLGSVRYVASTSYDNTALVRCYAQVATQQIATTLLTLYGNIGLIVLLFHLMK